MDIFIVYELNWLFYFHFYWSIKVFKYLQVQGGVHMQGGVQVRRTYGLQILSVLSSKQKIDN